MDRSVEPIYLPEHRLVCWRGGGTFDAQVARRLLVRIVELEAVLPPFDRLLDLREVTDIRLGFTDLEAIVARRRGYRGRPVTAALVVHGPLGFGMARMYQSLMAGGAIDVRVHEELLPALARLGVPLAALEGVVSLRETV